MIAIDDATNHVVPRLTLLLTASEASELRDVLVGILAESAPGRHEHVSDLATQREITVALYRHGDAQLFAEPIAALIRQERR